MKLRDHLAATRASAARLARYATLWGLYIRRTVSPARNMSASAAPDARALVPLALPATPRGEREMRSTALHRKLLDEISAARPDLGLTPSILDHLAELNSSDDLFSAVDGLAAQGARRSDVAAALYMLLLRRLPDHSEQAVFRRHPRHLLITILSGDEYRRQGRRIAPPA